MDSAEFLKNFKGKLQLGSGANNFGLHYVKKKFSGNRSDEVSLKKPEDRTSTNQLKINQSESNVRLTPSLASIKLPAIKNVKRQFFDKDIKPMNERHHLGPLYVKKTGSSLSYLPKRTSMNHDAPLDIKVNRSYNLN